MKKLLSSLLTITIGLSSVTVPPVAQIALAQTRSPQQELERLLQQSVKQVEQGQFQQSVATLQQALMIVKLKLQHCWVLV